MRIHPVTTEGLETPGLAASKLPPQIVDRAVTGLCWISLFTAVTSILITAIEQVLDAPGVGRAQPAHHSEHLVSLFQQKLG